MSSSRVPKEELKDVPERLPVPQPALPSTDANLLKRALPGAEDRQFCQKRVVREYSDSLARLPVVKIRRLANFLQRLKESGERAEEEAAIHEAGPTATQIPSEPEAETLPRPPQGLTDEPSPTSKEAPTAPTTEAGPQSLRTPIDYYQELTQMIPRVLPL